MSKYEDDLQRAIDKRCDRPLEDRGGQSQLSGVSCCWLFAILAICIGGSIMCGTGCDRHRPAPAPVEIERDGGRIHVKVGDTFTPETPESRGRKYFLAHVRNRMTRCMQADGFASVGADGTPLTADQVAKVHAAIDDETILASAVEHGAYDANAPPKLSGLFQWIKDHVKQLEALLKHLLGVASLL